MVVDRDAAQKNVQSNAQKNVQSKKCTKKCASYISYKLKNIFDFVVYKHILLCYNEYTLNGKVVKNMYYYGTTTDGWTVLSYDNELLVDTGAGFEPYVSNVFGEIIKIRKFEVKEI